MASAKLQKPTHETSSHSHDEHKFSQKISEMTAKVFGHKQQEHQELTKHCTTCKCPEVQKKQHPASASIKDTKSAACTETNKKEKEGQTSKAHKDAKHTNCIELRKDKEKHRATTTAVKEPKQPVSVDVRQTENKEHHTKYQTANTSKTMIKKEHKDKPAGHYFSSMADQWKEKLMMMKKSKDSKSKDSSSSSDSDMDSEDGVREKQKKNKKHGN